MDIYAWKDRSIEGREVDFSQYRGQVLLVVNTASQCGFTGQYEGLEALYRQYKDRGLEILGFPSNQFGGQEPGSNEEVHSFCQVRFGVSFPLFEKTAVRGPEAHPLFVHLTQEQPFRGFDPAHPVAPKLEAVLKERFPEILEGDGVKWNFTKFLVDRAGRVVGRFEPTTEPSALQADLEALLGAEPVA